MWSGRIFDRKAFVAAIVVTALVSCASRAPSAAPSPFPIATGDYPMHGHAGDYSWMAGTVELDLACIYLDFGDRRRSPWGGRVALVVTPEQVRSLSEGDTVVIKGALSRLADGTCGAPSYVVASIEEH